MLRLRRHLALVQPLHGDDYGGGATVSAIAADTAARLLGARFGQAASHGIQQLVEQVASAGNGVREGLEAVAEPSSWGLDQGLDLDLDLDVEEIAAALTSVPERAAATRLPALRPPAFVALLVEHLLQAQIQVTALRTDNSGRADGDRQAAAAPHIVGDASGVTGAPVEREDDAMPSGRWDTGNSEDNGVKEAHDFVGLVLSKLARRGHARLAAHALWRSMRPHVTARPEASGGGAAAGGGGEHPPPTFGVPGSLGPAGVALGGVTDPAAAEKLTEALLLDMVASRVSDVEGTAVLGALFGGAAWSRSYVRCPPSCSHESHHCC